MQHDAEPKSEDAQRFTTKPFLSQNEFDALLAEELRGMTSTAGLELDPGAVKKLQMNWSRVHPTLFEHSRSGDRDSIRRVVHALVSFARTRGDGKSLHRRDVSSFFHA